MGNQRDSRRVGLTGFCTTFPPAVLQTRVLGAARRVPQFIDSCHSLLSACLPCPCRRPARRPPGGRRATPSTFHRVSVVRLPLHGVPAQEASPLSEPLDVPVLLTQDGDLVLEQDGVQPHLGVHQRHAAKPAGELVHAGLPLGEVVWIGPAGSSGRLVGRKGGVQMIVMSFTDGGVIIDC